MVGHRELEAEQVQRGAELPFYNQRRREIGRFWQQHDQYRSG